MVLAPVVLALQQHLGEGAREPWCAYVAGFEVWAELIGRDADKHHGKGWHPTAVFGCVAAAAAAAWMRKLSAAQCSHALGLAASMAGGVVANFGSMAKPLQVGFAVRNGMLAAQLAASGATASEDALESLRGFLAALSPCGRVRLAGDSETGQRWRILEQGVSIKRYPVCYAVHRAVDAALSLAPALLEEQSAIIRVDVQLGHLQAAMLRYPCPDRSLEAKFSAQYAIACALRRGHLGLADLTDAAVREAQVQALMPRITVATSQEMDPEDSLFSVADQVHVVLANGRTLSSEPVKRAKGHATRPLDSTELHAKFIDCASQTMDTAGAEQWWQRAQGAIWRHHDGCNARDHCPGGPVPGFLDAAGPCAGRNPCRSLLLDSIGCALAGRQHAAVPKAATAAQAMCPGDAATGLGSGRRLGVLGAVLDSGAAIRALDFNDFYWGPGIGGHPSDLFAVSLALAEARNASLGELLDATVVGYELYLRLLDLMEPHGAFDHTSAMTLGAAGIAARLLGLAPLATGHALAMALVRGPALSALRHGAISEAKATAPVTAATSGVVAAQLAQAGIAGPVAACLGPVGLAGWVRERAHVDALARPDGFGEHMLGVSIKGFPCIGTAQAAVACALSVHQQARAAGSAIASVAVQLTHSPLIVHQTSSAYARPRDRETADHSFFSLLALGLCDGDLQPAQFAAGRYEYADVVAMSERLQFSFDLDSADRGLFPARIDAGLQDGSRVTSWTPHPPGHPGNPLASAGLLVKWRGLAQDCLSTRQADDIAQWCLQGDRSIPVAALMEPLAFPHRMPESTA